MSARTQTGEIRSLIVRLVVTDDDRNPLSFETKIESVDEIEPAMIESVSKHLIKRATAFVVSERSMPKNQLRMLGVDHD